MELAIAVDQGADHVLWHAHVIKINNAVGGQVKRQRGILDVAKYDLLVNSTLVHFDHFRHSIGKRGRRHGGGRRGVAGRGNVWRG